MPASIVERIIDHWQTFGRYTFTREELADELGKWDTATRDALRRLTRRSRIARPRVGFYVIVPLEYRTAGAPPTSWFIDPLMSYLGQPYYVGLLSAAELHGAAHHRPQEFQILTDGPTRPISVGRTRIRFIVNSSIDDVPVTRLKTATGTMQVSTSEATALDLLRYPHAAGGYDHIATVLSELAAAIDGKRLAEAAEGVPSVVARRTGYLLEQLGAHRAAEALLRRFTGTDLQLQPLQPGRSIDGAERDDRWRLYLNRSLELDAP